MPLAIIPAHDLSAPLAVRQPSGLLVTMAEKDSRLSSIDGVATLLLSVVAAVAAALGAWLVLGLDLAILFGLLRAFGRTSARPLDREWLVLDSIRARHCLTRRDGSIEEWDAPRALIRIRHASRAVFLRDRNRRRLIGHCLTDVERGELARLVTDILRTQAGSEVAPYSRSNGREWRQRTARSPT
jgi:hypothetical protein